MNATKDATGTITAKGWLLILAGLAVILLVGIRTIGNADFWSHLAAGRWIAENGIPREDVFSYTAAGNAWIDGSWLYDRVLFCLWNLGGGALVILAHALAAAAAFALLVPVVRRWAGSGSIALALIVCSWLLFPRLVIGPHVLALVFAAAFVAVLSRARAAWAAWAVIAPLQVLWANIHLSFLLGPVICAVFAVQRYFRGRSGDVEEGGALAFNTLVAIAVASLVLPVVNPYHVRIYGHVFGLVGAMMGSMAREWISPFSSQFVRSIGVRNVVTITLIIGAGGLVAERRRLPLALTILAIGSAFAVVFSIWYTDFFAVLAFPFLALSLRAIGDALGGLIRKLLGSELPVLSLAGGALALLLAAATAGGLVTNACYTDAGSASGFGFGVEDDLFPGAAGAVIGHAAFPDRVFNLPTDGGYLAWQYPSKRVFMDSRMDVYGREIFELGGQCLAGVDKAWDELDSRWGTSAAIFNCTVPGAAFTARAMLQGGRWVMVYFDGTSVVLVRARSDFEALAQDAELQAGGLKLLEQARAAYAGKLGGFARPANDPRLIGAGNFYIAVGRFEEARAVYSLLTRGTPGMASAWLNLGTVELQLGNFRDAETALLKASELMPKNVWPWLHLSRVYVLKNDREGERIALERARSLSEAVTKAFLDSQTAAAPKQ